MLSISDLFVVGTALDLVGGCLIAHGLLVSLDVIAARSRTYWGSNPTVTVGAVKDRVDAAFGLATLAIGFTLQATGYVLTLADEPVVRASATRALIAAELALVGAGMTVGLWRYWRDRLISQSLIKLASRDEGADALKLAAYGRAWSESIPDETDEQTVIRVFGAISR